MLLQIFILAIRYTAVLISKHIRTVIEIISSKLYLPMRDDLTDDWSILLTSDAYAHVKRYPVYLKFVHKRIQTKLDY